jgi:hypothetical protein
VGGGDGSDPPYFNMEITHIVAHIKTKMSTSNKSAQNYGDSEMM